MTAQPARDVHDSDTATVTKRWSVRSTLTMWAVWACATVRQARRAPRRPAGV
jgi:hypothetical protein